MKFSMERGAALEAMSALMAVVATKITIPILGHVRMETSPAGGVELMATDLDMRLARSVPARIDRPGGITMDAPRLHQILRALPDGADFTIEHDPSEPKARLAAGRSRYQLSVLPLADFPVIKVGAINASATLTAGALTRILTLGSEAAEKDEARPYLATTYLHTVGDQLRAVSANPKRVQYAQTPAPDNLAFDPGVMLHARTVAVMLRILSGAREDEPVTLDLSERMIGMERGGSRFVSKVIGGDDGQRYVDYRRVMPPTKIGVVTVDTDILIGAVARAMVTSDRRDAGLKVEVSGTALTVSSRDEEGNTCVEEVEVAWSGKDAVATMLNGQHVAAALSQVRTENTLITMPGEGHPGVTIGETDDKSDWYAMVTKFKGW